MLTTRCWMLTILLALILAPGGVFAQKITVDPNAPGTQAAEEQTEEIDVRLAQKIDFEATRKSVSAILDELSEKTEVSLRSGHNKSDWQVRDRKMNIYSKDTTLASLMNSIARVMKFKWSKEKSKDGQWVYRLYMDRRTLLDEEAKRAREDERLAKLEAQKRQDALDSICSLANLSPQEIEALREENPFLYVLAKSGLPKPLQGLFSEVPAISQALANGEVMDLTASSVSAQGRTHMVDTLKAICSVMQTASGKHESFNMDDAYGRIDQATIRINPNLERMQESHQGIFILGEIKVGLEDRPGIQIPLLDPSSNMAKMIGETLVTAEETGESMNDADKKQEMAKKFVAAYSADLKKIEPQEPKVEHPDEPALHEKIKMQPKSDQLHDVQSALAESSGFAVVSDSFKQLFVANFPKSDEIELKDALEKISSLYRYNWEKHGPVIELRDKQWFKKRATQIPDAWIEDWRNKLKQTGTLELNDIAAICSLTRDQYVENIGSEPVISNSGMRSNYYAGREMMRIYSALSEAQRYAAWTESGLDLWHLLPHQWTQVEKLLRNRGKSQLLQNTEFPLVLRIEREDQDGKHYYKLRIKHGDGIDIAGCKIEVPHYTPPKEPEEPKQDNPQEHKEK